MLLPRPAEYFPIRGGRYDVAPALRPFGTSFGNGPADHVVFQLDDRFPEYRANKLACQASRERKHVATAELDPVVATAVAKLLLSRFVEEQPEFFELSNEADGGLQLNCALSRERLWFDAEMRLQGVCGDVQYSNALDALACQVQEDLAVVCLLPDGADHLAGYHICVPSHWAPEEKYGLGFSAIHAPVPGIEAVTRVAGAMVEAMIHRGPFVRFVWGIDTDRRLNRHPEPPEGVNPVDWNSPPFDSLADDPVMLRVERQVTWGLPDISAALFVIRLYLTEGSQVRADPAKREALTSAIRSMSPESRTYKGIGAYADDLLQWLGKSPD